METQYSWMLDSEYREKSESDCSLLLNYEQQQKMASLTTEDYPVTIIAMFLRSESEESRDSHQGDEDFRALGKKINLSKA
jgi:hypothetical protein